jgi:hypothetical protein
VAKDVGWWGPRRLEWHLERKDSVSGLCWLVVSMHRAWDCGEIKSERVSICGEPLSGRET